MVVTVFWILFVATVIGLAVALYTGRTGRRKQHFIAVTVFVGLLYATVKMTRRLVEAVDFPPAELAFHLKFAISAAALLLPVVVTGIGYARRGGVRWRWAHRVAVVVFVLAVLAATATGIWIFTLA